MRSVPQAAMCCAVLGLLFIGQLYYRHQQSHGTQQGPVALLMVGDPLPVTTVVSVHSSSRTPLSEAVTGACTALYFFDHECPGCIASGPTWSSSSAGAFPSFQVLFVGITGDRVASAEFVQNHDLPHAAVVTAAAYPRQLGIAGVPTIWVARDGVVRHILEGAAATSADAFRMEWCEQ